MNKTYLAASVATVLVVVPLLAASAPKPQGQPYAYGLGGMMGPEGWMAPGCMGSGV